MAHLKWRRDHPDDDVEYAPDPEHAVAYMSLRTTEPSQSEPTPYDPNPAFEQSSVGWSAASTGAVTFTHAAIWDATTPRHWWQRRALKVYWDRNDWWIGYYRGDTHHYVCPIPCLVIRWRQGLFT